MKIIRIMLILTAIIFIIAALAMNCTIFEVNNRLCELKSIDNPRKQTLCLLEYDSSTGSGWVVIDSNDPDLINEGVVLYSDFDPRLLRDNSDFKLDYMAKYVVFVKKTWETEIDKERVTALSADKIIICYDGANEHYKLHDMSIPGILKSVAGCLIDKYRYSY